MSKKELILDQSLWGRVLISLAFILAGLALVFVPYYLSVFFAGDITKKHPVGAVWTMGCIMIITVIVLGIALYWFYRWIKWIITGK